MSENAKKKHKCPPEPWPKPNRLQVPYADEHTPVEVAADMWFAHLRRVQRLSPMPRRTA